MKVKIAVGVAVAAGAAFAWWKLRNRASRPTCSAGASWHEATITELMRLHTFSPAVQDHIRRYGGYCARKGFVSDAGTRPLDDVLTGPITSPYQLE